MAKEWILNSVMNRFQLNFKKNVGAVAAEIRRLAPKSVEEWRAFYYSSVRAEQHIESLGRRLYTKITEVIPSEIAEITEADCMAYMKEVVIDRTFEGYQTEIETIYGQLQDKLGVGIEAAPDEWDRLFNIDFFIKIGERFIGLQVKPISDVSHIAQIFKERDLQEKTHRQFKDQYGGAVFYVFSKKEGRLKKIYSVEVIDEIRCEIDRLRSLSSTGR